MNILHSADWHIQDSQIDECRKVLDALCVSAEQVFPDLIVLAGDLTHRYDVKLDSKTARLLFETIIRLNDVAPVAIVGGTPFHDGNIPNIFDSMPKLEEGAVFVACDYPQQIVLYKESLFPIEDAVRILGAGDCPEAVISLVPAPTKKFLETSETMERSDATIASGMGLVLANCAARAEPYKCPHIVVGHWSIGGAMISDKQLMVGRDIEISRDQVSLAQADLVCLGHIHKAQQIGDNIFYSGSTYSLDAGELDDKGFWYHEIVRVEQDTFSLGPSGFVQLPATRRVVIKYDLTEGGPGINTALDFSFAGHNIKDAIVKLSFRVWQDEADQIDQGGIKNHLILKLQAKDVNLEVIRVPRDNVRCKEYFQAQTLREKLIQQAEIRGKPEDFDEILAKADMLESMPPDKILEDLPRP